MSKKEKMKYIYSKSFVGPNFCNMMDFLLCFGRDRPNRQISASQESDPDSITTIYQLLRR